MARDIGDAEDALFARPSVGGPMHYGMHEPERWPHRPVEYSGSDPQLLVDISNLNLELLGLCHELFTHGCILVLIRVCVQPRL